MTDRITRDPAVSAELKITPCEPTNWQHEYCEAARHANQLVFELTKARAPKEQPISTADLAREIKRRNPNMTLEEIGRLCGVTKQAVSQHLQKSALDMRQPQREEDAICRTCQRLKPITPTGDCCECVMWHTRFWTASRAVYKTEETP